eukprot:PhM_4_TR9518/c3_g2_i2/m.98170
MVVPSIYLSVRKALPLTDAHKLSRVEFCRQLQSADITNYFWTDEKWFTIENHTRKTWAMPGADRVSVERKSWPLKLMVWGGGISPLGRSPLFIFDGNVNSEQYCAVLDHFRDWIEDEFG